MMATIQQVRNVAKSRPVVLFVNDTEIEWESKWQSGGAHVSVVQWAAYPSKAEAYDVVISELMSLAPCEGCGSAVCGQLTYTATPYFVGRLEPKEPKAKKPRVPKVAMPEEKTWACPKCKTMTVQAKAIEVAHRCPSNKNVMTHFKVVEE